MNELRILLYILNSIIVILNENKYQIFDDNDPSWHLNEIYHNPATDKLFFKCVDSEPVNNKKLQENIVELRLKLRTAETNLETQKGIFEKYQEIHKKTLAESMALKLKLKAAKTIEEVKELLW